MKVLSCQLCRSMSFSKHLVGNTFGRCSSFYHHPESVRSWFKADFSDNHVFVRADLKNYDGEIEKFLDWAKPYIRPATGNCLGWVWYEEWDVPELIIWENDNG